MSAEIRHIQSKILYFLPKNIRAGKRCTLSFEETANKHDVVTDIGKFTEYVRTQNVGFGLASLAPEHAAPNVMFQVRKLRFNKCQVKSFKRKLKQNKLSRKINGYIFYVIYSSFGVQN
ncbi:MAG: hypothetical protein HAW66_08390 [Shewanella sp.]|nr:hypothetical protein [Shewanella sp.]